MSIDKELKEIREKLTECVKDVISCFQCGTCVAACPVARLTGGEFYHPRRFVRKTLEGQARTLLEEPMLWLCTSCHACLEHCPQKVPVSELIQGLQNIACDLGCAPEDIVSEVENIISTGWALQPSESVNKRREQLGLPPVPVTNRNSRELQVIAKATELQNRLKQIRKRREAEAAAATEGDEVE